MSCYLEVKIRTKLLYLEAKEKLLEVDSTPVLK